MKLTRKCYGCKEDFRKEEMLEYTSYSGKTSQWYCRNCYEQKVEREKFSNEVCKIFGIKTPGPRIWTERKRLQATYGYTDQVIVDCLEYIYKIEGAKKLVESLCLVNPTTVDKMMQYKRSQSNKANNLVNATISDSTEYIVPIVENKKNKKKQLLNPEDFLDE